MQVGGLELRQKLRALGASIPVIIVTSSVDPLSRARAMQEGAFAYLTKPFNDKVLIRQVMTALGRKS
jgi:FixJ family two-component response regulator